MRLGRPLVPLELTTEEQTLLESWARRRTTRKHSRCAPESSYVRTSHRPEVLAESASMRAALDLFLRDQRKPPLDQPAWRDILTESLAQGH